MWNHLRTSTFVLLSSFDFRHSSLLRSHSRSRNAFALADAAARPDDQAKQQRQDRWNDRRLNLVFVLDPLDVLILLTLDLGQLLIAIALQALFGHGDLAIDERLLDLELRHLGLQLGR